MRKILNIVLSLTCSVLLAACGKEKPVLSTVANVSETNEDIGSETYDYEGESFDPGYYDEASETYSAGQESVKNDEPVVHVCGAVVNPGVYTLSKGAIKQDALIAAGGFSEGASTCYVNLAEAVKDGEKIYFPYEDELKENILLTEGFGEDDSIGKLININTADKEALMTLPGIGEKRAQDIIDYRTLHGDFKSIEDIKNVKGIKDNIYNDIKDSICI